MPDESDFPSPKEMEEWLRNERVDAERALALRMKDAEALVSEYSKGRLTSDEAADRTYQYSVRWGEPLPGVGRSQGISDEQILAKLDETRAKLFARSRSPSGRGPGMS